jgi:hypothetical protein
MRPEPKYVLQLAANLETARADVLRLEEEWDKLFPESASAESANAPTVRIPSAPRSNSAIAKTLAHINANPNEDFVASHLAYLLHVPPASMRTNLAKLYKQGDIDKQGNGIYRAKPKENLT